jgi:hypothetical protein
VRGPRRERSAQHDGLEPVEGVCIRVVQALHRGSREPLEACPNRLEVVEEAAVEPGAMLGDDEDNRDRTRIAAGRAQTVSLDVRPNGGR